LGSELFDRYILFSCSFCGLYLLIVMLISSSFGIFIKEFKARHISDYSFSFFRNFRCMVIEDDGQVSFLILQLVQSLMNSIVLFVALDEFGLIDLWGKRHNALIFIFDALLESIRLLIDLSLMVGLEI
jgi:hypothetical protein